MTDLRSSCRIMHEMAQMVSGIPCSPNGNDSFESLKSVFRAKQALIRARFLQVCDQTFVISEGRVRIGTSEWGDTNELWSFTKQISIEEELVNNLVASSWEQVMNILIRLKTMVTVNSSLNEWSFSAGRRANTESESLKSICESIISFFSFMEGFMDHESAHLFGRKLWARVVPLVLKTNGRCSRELNWLESTVIGGKLVPSDISRVLASQWEKEELEKERHSITVILSKVRDNLVHDLNRATIHLNRLPSKNLQSYIPETVTKEASRIVCDYVQSESVDSKVISKIVSLFIVMRQPELSDPDAVNPRHSALFFNDCAYLALALCLSGRGLSAEIHLLRSIAGKSMAWFLNVVKDRAASHLRASGGLLETPQIGDSEDSIFQCFAEIRNCTKDWKAVRVPTDISDVWISTMLDAIMKKMTKLCIEAAKTAVTKSSSKTGGILSSSSATVFVTSGLWSVHKRFIEEINSLNIPRDFMKQQVSWMVTDRISTALTASDFDIMSLDPLCDDQMLYGISWDGFEAILHCNPILQRDTNDTLRKLASRLMIRDDPVGQMHVRKPEGRNFAALFD